MIRASLPLGVGSCREAQLELRQQVPVCLHTWVGHLLALNHLVLCRESDGRGKVEPSWRRGERRGEQAPQSGQQGNNAPPIQFSSSMTVRLLGAWDPWKSRPLTSPRIWAVVQATDRHE